MLIVLVWELCESELSIEPELEFGFAREMDEYTEFWRLFLC